MGEVRKDTLREELAKRQQSIKDAKLPVVVIVEGYVTQHY